MDLCVDVPEINCIFKVPPKNFCIPVEQSRSPEEVLLVPAPLSHVALDFPSREDVKYGMYPGDSAVA